MEKQKSLKKNYLYNLSYQVLAIIVPLITTPYVSRILGASRLGDYAYTSSIVSYFGIVAVLGTSAYAQREIAFTQKDGEARSQIFYEVLALRLILVAVVTAVYLLFLSHTGKYRVLYLIQLCTVFSWALDISWFFQGMEDFRVTVVRNCCVKIISVVLIFLFVKKEGDIGIYTGIICGAALIGNMTMWPFLRKYIRKPQKQKLQPFRHLAGSLELFAAIVCTQVYSILDQTMLGAMVNTTQVGYYFQAQKIIMMESSILGSLTAVLLPRMAAVLKEKDYKMADFYFQKVIYFGIMLNLPMAFGTALVSGYLIPVFLGKGYEPAVSVMRILSMMFLTQGISGIAGTLLLAMERQKQYVRAVFTGAVVNLICNSVFILRFEADGVAAASIISELVVEIIMLRALKPEFGTDIIKKAFLHYLLPALGMAAVVLTAEIVLPVNLFSLMFLGILGVGAYTVILILIKDAFFMEEVHKVRGIIRRR